MSGRSTSSWALGLVALVGLNAVVYRSSVAPAPSELELEVLGTDDDVAAGTGVTPLRWADLAATRAGPDGRPVYPETVAALEGKRVQVTGYGFLVKSGVVEGQVRSLVVMPPSLASCCGPACTPVLEKLVFVDAALAPLPRELWVQPGLYVRFEGVLRLSAQARLGSLFTLEGGRGRLYEVEGTRGRLVYDATRSPPWRAP